MSLSYNISLVYLVYSYKHRLYQQPQHRIASRRFRTFEPLISILLPDLAHREYLLQWVEEDTTSRQTTQAQSLCLPVKIRLGIARHVRTLQINMTTSEAYSNRAIHLPTQNLRYRQLISQTRGPLSPFGLTSRRQLPTHPRHLHFRLCL